MENEPFEDVFPIENGDIPLLWGGVHGIFFPQLISSFFNPNASCDCNSYLHLASKFMVNVGRHISYMDPIGKKKNLLLVVVHDQHFLVELLTSLLTFTLRNIY